MSRMLVFVLAIIAVASAGIAKIDNMNLSPTEDVTTSFVVVTKDDTKFGVSEAYLDLEMVIHSQTTTPKASMLLFHSDKSSFFGVGNVFCCTPKLQILGQCETVGELIIRNKNLLKFSHAISEKFQVDSEMKVYFWKDFSEYVVMPDDEGSSTAKVYEYLELEPTGPWSLVLTQCASNKTEHVSGTMEWRNPFGYLSGGSFANLPIYLILVSSYFGLLVVWSAFAYYFRKDLMGLQHVITATVAIAVIESLLWACYFTYFNYHGVSLNGANWVGAFLGALKMTSLRTMLLMVAIGYSITRAELSQGVTIAVTLLTISYFFTEIANEYIFVGKYMGLEIPEIYDYVASAVLSAFNMVYVIWIAYALNANMIYLRQKNQEEKLSLYKIFAAALLVFLSLSTLCYILQLGFSVAKFQTHLWSFWWIWNAYWQFSYLILTLIVSYLWRPNSNNLRYSYSFQIPQEEPQEKSEEGEELSGDVQLKGGSRETSEEAEASDSVEGYTSDALENLVL